MTPSYQLTTRFPNYKNIANQRTSVDSGALL
jgi:hypothetical protein